VVSNCVLNLVPDKKAVFSEIFRVLKPGGHFSISDIVITGDLPTDIKEAAEMYAGCVAGAIHKEDYLRFISEAGFTNITIQKDKPIIIPSDILQTYLGKEALENFTAKETLIRSITVYAEKPGATCKPGSGCC
jgi:ubiquinone/menaquinone biosynthesis C-methylase UbiE